MGGKVTVLEMVAVWPKTHKLILFLFLINAIELHFIIKFVFTHAINFFESEVNVGNSNPEDR